MRRALEAATTSTRPVFFPSQIAHQQAGLHEFRPTNDRHFVDPFRSTQTASVRHCRIDDFCSWPHSVHIVGQSVLRKYRPSKKYVRNLDVGRSPKWR